ncbi:MAG: acetyltransferase [Myxococcota bacterium]
MERLLIYGAGGLGKETLEAAHASGDYEVVGFIDDNPKRRGERFAGLPILGGRAVLEQEASARVVFCLGSPTNRTVRQRVVDELGLDLGRLGTVIHPSATIAAATTVGPGTILLSQVVSTADATIGAHVVAMPQVVFTHDCIVEDFVTFGAGARLGGGTRIGTSAYIGSGASIREGTSIGEASLVGMAAAVVRDIPAGETWLGVPARPSRH